MAPTVIAPTHNFVLIVNGRALLGAALLYDFATLT